MLKGRNTSYLLGLLLILTGLTSGCVATFFAAAETVVYLENVRQTIATVNLKANPDKVYAAALNRIDNNPKLLITARNDASRYIEFSEGEYAASLKISSVSEDTSQLTIASYTPLGKQNTTNMVLMTVENICKELNIPYRIVKN
ncbi:MAG: hypothetical protein NTV58_16825 [Deltaproteobacteria bacterium]|nr:hypothetical protein [Deltaproteobacteria bacterium]